MIKKEIIKSEDYNIDLTHQIMSGTIQKLTEPLLFAEEVSYDN